jgi:hypothetical protein
VWGRSGDSPLRPREPENPEELTSWFVTAARFERAGDIEILPQPDSNGYPRAKVVLHGRWKPTDDGLVLRQAGFAKVDERTWEQDWVYWHGAWMPEHAAGE